MGSLGQLPKEYNKAVHGPYDPAVFYGKKDVPLGQVEKKHFNIFYNSFLRWSFRSCLHGLVDEISLQLQLVEPCLELTGGGTTSTVSPSTVASHPSFRWDENIFEWKFFILELFSVCCWILCPVLLDQLQRDHFPQVCHVSTLKRMMQIFIFRNHKYHW